MFVFKKSNIYPNMAGPVVMIPTTAGTAYKAGHALTLSAGKAILATGAVKPGYVCLKDYTAPATGNADIPCVAVTPGQIWKCPVSADPTALNIGDKVTVNAGIGVTATTTGGVATIVNKLGAAAANADILVKFE